MNIIEILLKNRCGNDLFCIEKKKNFYLFIFGCDSMKNKKKQLSINLLVLSWDCRYASFYS